MALNLHGIVSRPFDENSYVVWQPEQTEALVVDPGFEPEKILAFVQKRGLEVVAILNTHGHADHIAGNEALKEAYPLAPLIIGEGDAAMLRDPILNLSAVFGEPLVSPLADRTLRDGEVLEVAGQRWETRWIPGHSPGHVVFVGHGIVLGGDVLFRGGIGRCDFPGGSLNQLLEGIHRHLLTLPPTTEVYPGHGPATTIAREAATNPYLG
jgi:glyoxylase-like metal-dependent hydrolase (beta-lactamase superfamily II)